MHKERDTQEFFFLLTKCFSENIDPNNKLSVTVTIKL